MSVITKSYDAYLFDLDGTLVDTAPDLGQALNASLQQAGYRGVTTEQARNWIGHGAKFSLTQALAHHDLILEPAAVDALLANFLDYYASHVAEESTVYAGVVDTLDHLSHEGRKLAVVTNKPSRFVLPLLDAMSLDGYFTSVICGDTAAAPKPAPDPIDLCLNQLGVATVNALMVGDSITDVEAAKAAGVDVACFRHGYNHGIDVETLKATYLFHRMDQILPSDTADIR